VSAARPPAAPELLQDHQARSAEDVLPGSGLGPWDAPAVIWCVAGNDSGGGAGLSADLRAADAFGVHACPVVAAITAQHSHSVRRVEAVSPELLAAQMDTLAEDLRPRAIKTGVLGSAANVRTLARMIDRLRAQAPLALVVDPVLRASSGDVLADRELLAALRGELLPRATLLTPNRREAAALLGRGEAPAAALPELARALQALGAEAVCITGGDAARIAGGDAAWIIGGNAAYIGVGPAARIPGTDAAVATSTGGAIGTEGDGGDGGSITRADAAADPGAHDWLQTPHAQGWLSGPRFATRHSHGTGCSFASAAAAALARGFVAADAVVLARMAVAEALRCDAALAPPGHGPGPVRLQSGFGVRARALPMLWPEALPPTHLAQPPFDSAHPPSASAPDFADPAPPRAPSAAPAPPFRLARRRGATPAAYAIVDSAARAEAVLAAGVKIVQLRIKTAAPDAALRGQIAQALLAAHQCAAQLVVNDHWELACELGATAVHLGQEDLLALDAPSRRRLREAQVRGLQLSLSSHSLWELSRAAAWSPAAVACGPVWPTTTKAMPWMPQGLHNLAWWCAVSPAPVIAIGGILSPRQAEEAARCGPAAVALVRALNDDPAAALPVYQASLVAGAASTPQPVPLLPNPTLPCAGLPF
jgi:hydroxymethylpyrimidine kinase/phosphomethylpyrimidine kinase/thiamine-phosphate diphosphorylase